MPYGPWDGKAWFRKMQTMGAELCVSIGPSHPLFLALYEPICQDMGIEPIGTIEHRAMIWERVCSGDAFTTKGERVSLRRWFSWLSAADEYLKHWHSRLLLLTSIGQALDVYKHYTDVPLWKDRVRSQDGGADAGAAGAAGGGEDEEEDEKDEDEDARHGDAAGAAGAADAVNDGGYEFKEDKGQVKEKEGRAQIKELRKQSKNTLFVVVAILSRDNIRNLVALILEVCRPIWSKHSDDAHRCRSPDNCLRWYYNSAHCDSMQPWEECASVFLDMRKLERIGFITECAKGLPSNIRDTDPIVQGESVNAYHMSNLFCGLAHHRIGSMMWHSHSLPGMFALMAGGNHISYDDCAAQI